MIELIKDKILIKFLLLMVIVGTLLKMENSQDIFCVIGLGDMFTKGSVLLVLITFFLLVGALKSKNKKTKLILVALDLMIWILKYMFYKGGSFIQYDFVAIGLRVLLLLTILTETKHKLNITIAIVFSILCVALKTNYAPFPLGTKEMLAEEDRRWAEQKSEIIGHYSGRISHKESGNVAFIDLTIDSTHLKIKGVPPFKLKNKYLLNLEGAGYASIRTIPLDDMDAGNEYSVNIYKSDNNELVCDLRYSDKYVFNLDLKRQP